MLSFKGVSASIFFVFLYSPWTISGQATFRFPIDGDRTPTPGGEFGVFTNTRLGDIRYCGQHLGVDVGAGRAGTKVYPMTAGTVKSAGMIRGLGYAVIIDHTLPQGDPVGPIVTAVYYHMKPPATLLTNGAPVTPETSIGSISDVPGEYGTGPHLHFGIRARVYETCDVRTGRWFYPGYTNIYSDAKNCVGGTLQCDSTDSIHGEIRDEWFPPLEFLLSRENTGPQPCPPNFFDSFSRQDGPVGNGWVDSTGNVNGNLVIRNGALSTPGPDGGAGIYRPINLSGPVTVSATLTPGNGYGGLLNRYGTGVLFGSNGDLSSGYGVWLYRADQNYSNSQVILLLNGTELASVPSSFQFGASVTAMVTFSPDGSLKGSVSGSGSIFNFSFGPRTMVLPASNIMISLGFPDGRSSVITHPTVDNLIVSYSCNPGPPELNLVKVTPLLTNGKYMALSCSDLPDPPAGYDWWLYNLALEIPTWDWNWRAFRAGGSGPTKPCIDNNYIWDLSSPGLIPSDSDVYLLVFALSQSIPDLPVKDAHYWPGNNPVYYGVVHWNGTSGTVK